MVKTFYYSNALKSTPQLNTRATAFQPPKSVSSTRQMSQFYARKPSVQHTLQFNTQKSVISYKTLSYFCLTDAFVFNWRFFCSTIGCVELTVFGLNWLVCWPHDFLCWTEVFCVEMRDFGGWKGVLNWSVELTGVLKWESPIIVCLFWWRHFRYSLSFTLTLFLDSKKLISEMIITNPQVWP